jgi:uncharacterized RDD family membrane protein YckC
MEQVSITTTQNVALDYEVATLGDRIIATLIDYGVYVVYWIIITIIVNIFGGYGSYEDPFLWIFLSAPVLLYDLLMEWIFNGQSLGKMAMRIKVVKIDGTRPSIGSYLIRNLLRFVDSTLWFWTIGTFTILATGTGQRLGDLAAGTTVVRSVRRTRIYDTILHRIDPNYIPAFPQVHRLTDRDIATIKDVMIICSRTRNWNGLRDLSIRVKEVMEVNPNIPDFQFLNIVIKDYTNSYQA